VSNCDFVAVKSLIDLAASRLALHAPALRAAQQPAMPVIGYLSARSPEDTAHLVEAFRRGLGETGFFGGQDTCGGR
jgi:putative ABC transport system substrate-binding protein